MNLKYSKKLNDEQRQEIFREYEETEKSLSEIAEIYGVSRQTIYLVVKKFKQEKEEEQQKNINTKAKEY